MTAFHRRSVARGNVPTSRAVDLATLVQAATPSFIASAVECVEAATIVLAVGVTRGWRAPLIGTLAAALMKILPESPRYLARQPERWRLLRLSLQL